MRLINLAWIGPVGLLLIALSPVSSAAAPAPAPLQGLVTSCSSTSSCYFVFNTSTGTGWANATGSSISFKLPGEASASIGVSYSTYIEKLTGTYTYWTIGNFLGTDVNTGKVVYGTTNTNYTITCHGHSGRGGGCTYTYTTDNGTIVFQFTQAELTSTSVSCSPSTVKVAGKTSCTVTVTNLWNSTNFPVGKVKLSSFGVGSFQNHGACTLSSGSCTLSFHPSDNACSFASISATYPGNALFYKSNGSSKVTVTGGC